MTACWRWQSLALVVVGHKVVKTILRSISGLLVLTLVLAMCPSQLLIIVQATAWVASMVSTRLPGGLLPIIIFVWSYSDCGCVTFDE
jgi:hypothetical protein